MTPLPFTPGWAWYGSSLSKTLVFYSLGEDRLSLASLNPRTILESRTDGGSAPPWGLLHLQFPLPGLEAQHPKAKKRVREEGHAGLQDWASDGGLLPTGSLGT